MKALPQEDATRRLGAPADWNHETDGLCHTLDIVDTDDGFMRSAWLPTPAELEKLQRGEPLFLYIRGRAHPVVGLAVGFKEGGDGHG